MNLIVAVDNNWAIGRAGGLLFNLKRDMQFFRETTKGSVVIMGKRTFDSLPNGPLPGRVNIVVTNDAAFVRADVVIAHSIEDAIKAASVYDKPVFCIGGGQVYKQMLPYCDTAYVTRIQATVEDADTFFVDLDKEGTWYLSDESEAYEENGVSFTFCTYKK